jgi:hypothetical protein
MSCNQQLGVTEHLFSILSSNFKDIPSDVIRYYSKFRILLRIRYLNKLIEDKKFKDQEERRNHFLGISLDCEIDDEVPDEAQSLQNELYGHERDLLAVENLLCSYSNSHSMPIQL